MPRPGLGEPGRSREGFDLAACAPPGGGPWATRTATRPALASRTRPRVAGGSTGSSSSHDRHHPAARQSPAWSWLTAMMYSQLLRWPASAGSRAGLLRAVGRRQVGTLSVVIARHVNLVLGQRVDGVVHPRRASRAVCWSGRNHQLLEGLVGTRAKPAGRRSERSWREIG